VYGIERSAIADQAELIVKDNGYDDRVTIIKGAVMLPMAGLFAQTCSDPWGKPDTPLAVSRRCKCCAHNRVGANNAHH